jgi:DNA-binding LacI/PurR family transcriptional regulator
MIATRQTQVLVDNCTAAGCPYVLVEVDSANLTGLGSRLTVDNTGGATAIMRHLLELGHRRIGHVTGDWGHSSAQERLAVYRRALAEAGIPPADELVVRGRWNEEAGYTGARTLLGLADRPTAIFAASDMIAFGVIRAALENGLRVPDDLSVVGFDDIAIAGAFSPPLTTVRQEEDTLGRMACEHVAAWLQGTPPAQRETVFPVQLIVRQSTGPAPRR